MTEPPSKEPDEIENLDADELEEVRQTGAHGKVLMPPRPAISQRPPPRPPTPRPPSVVPRALERTPSPLPRIAPKAPETARSKGEERTRTLGYEQAPGTTGLAQLVPSETMVKAAERPLSTEPGASSLQAQRAIALAADLTSQIGAVRALGKTSDKPRIARLLVEQGLAFERAERLADALRCFEDALGLDAGQLSAAHGARRVARGASLDKRLALLDKQATLTTSEGERADLHVERARLLEAERREDHAAILAAYRAALTLRPAHSEALKGLEGALMRARTKADPGTEPSKRLDEQLSDHCALLATSYGGDPELVASYWASRARALEQKGDDVAAEEAWAASIAADGRVGPTREAYKRHLARRKAWARLRDVLAEEAGREHDLGRSVRLLHEAARISIERLADAAQATVLLEAAAARAPTDPAVDARVLEELVRLHDGRGDVRASAHARSALLAYDEVPSVRALEYRRLAVDFESLGELDAACSALETARIIDPKHAQTRAMLDRVYAARGRHEERLRLWLDAATRESDREARAAAYVRAAHVAEDSLVRPDEALEYLRAAWVTDTGNIDALDELTRMMLPPTEMRHGIGGGEGRSARALIDLLLQAVEATREPARKIAFLEKVAALFEDALGAPAEAAKIYQRVLGIEPRRRFALLGLQRAHERSGDFRGLAAAIETEAEQATDAALAAALLLRAAETFRARAGDPERAIALVRKVLEKAPQNGAALRALLEAQDAAGRPAEVARTLEVMISHARGDDAVPIWLELGEVRRRRLGDVDGAIAAWRAARALDPKNALAARELAHALRGQGAFRAVADLEESIAKNTEGPGPQSRAWVRAAEVWEGRLEDDERAQQAYAKALAARPEDLSAWDGLARLAERRGAYDALEAAYRLRIARDDDSPKQPLRIALSELLARRGSDPKAAAVALEQVLYEAPGHLATLRLLESLHRRTGNDVGLAKVLTAMAQTTRDPLAKRGILWDLVRVQERTDEGVTASPPIATYLLVYELDQSDTAALSAIVRLSMERLREGRENAGGMPNVRGLLAFALRRKRALTTDAANRASLALRLADLLEDSIDRAEQLEALSLYREALAHDGESPTAIVGLARVAGRLGDLPSMFAAEVRGGDMALDRARRVAHLLRAAELAPRVAAPEGGEAVALDLLTRALHDDADSAEAAAAIGSLLLARGETRRLVELLQEAATGARRKERVVALCREGAHHAAAIDDLPVAIALLKRGREADPRDATLTLELGEALAQQRAWVEAAAILDEGAALADEQANHPLQVRAHRALAGLFEGPLESQERALSELKLLCELAPDDVDAQRRLANALHSRGDAAGALRALEALAGSSSVKAAEQVAVLAQIAELHTAAGELRAADDALRRAVRIEPDPRESAFERFAKFHQRHGGDNVYGRALGELASESGADPRWRIALGELEVHRIGLPNEGLAHLREAVKAAELGLGEWPAAQLAYAEALLAIGSIEDAVRALRELSTREPTHAAALEALHRALAALHKRDELQTIDELRAYFGYAGSAATYRARRMPASPPRPDTLDDVTIHGNLMPPAVRTVGYELLVILSDQLAKVYPPDLASLGVGSRDKLGPRSTHPFRVLADRFAQALSVPSFELYVHDAPSQRMLVENTDPPALVVPRSLETLPDLEIAFALARLMAKVATRTWLVDKLDAEELEDLVVAATEPLGGPSPRKRVAEVEELAKRVQKVLSRKARRQLEEIVPRVVPLDGARFLRGIDQGALRAAYLLTGDATSALDHLRRFDERAMHELAPDTVIGDLLRFILSADAAAFRRRLGTTWS